MKSLISFIICLCCTTGIYAQPKLYEETKQIQGDGYTYQCETDGVVVDLYNTNQQFVKIEQKKQKDRKVFQYQRCIYSTIGTGFMDSF